MSAAPVVAPRRIMVGDEEIAIGRFRGLKAVEAAAVVTSITEAVPTLQTRVNGFVRDFEANNTERITPAMVGLPRYRELGLDREDIEKEPDGVLLLPQPPTQQQQFLFILPTLFKEARKELTKLIGVVLIPNDELEKADDADTVEEAILRYGKLMMRRAYIEQLAEILLAAWQVIGEQFSEKEELMNALGELPFLRMLRSTGQSPSPEESATHATEEEISAELEEAEKVAQAIHGTQKDESLTSSTDSAPPMDGTAEPLFTESPGLSSSD